MTLKNTGTKGSSRLLRKTQTPLGQIPPGKVTTYGEIARVLRTSPRAAGRLVASNPDATKYPCYKVIMSNGELGGYTGPGGLKEKKRLLEKEGIHVKGNHVIGYKNLIHRF